MSKSLNNYIGIEESPREIFGKVMSISDEVMFLYYELVTDVPREQINKSRKELEAGELHPRDVKVKLAKEICRQFHNEEAADNAEEEFNRIFVKKDVPDDIDEYTIPEDEMTDGKIWIIKLLVLTGMAKSNGEARRLIKGGGVSIDGEKMTDEDLEMSFDSESVIKVGKRRFVKIVP